MAVHLHISLVKRDDYLWTMLWPMLFWRYKDHKVIIGKPVSSNIRSKITNWQNKTKYESYVIEAEEYESEKNIHKWGMLN